MKDMNVPPEPTIDTDPEAATIAIELGFPTPLRFILWKVVSELKVFFPVKLKFSPLTILFIVDEFEDAVILASSTPDTVLV
jgi:hypothetical protein